MTPLNRLGVGTSPNLSSQSSNPSYNNISSMGVPSTQDEMGSSTENPAEKLMLQVQPLVENLQNINKNFVGGDTEFSSLMDAIATWLSAKSSALNQGGQTSY